MAGSAPGLFTGVDRALVMAAFGERLRRVGVATPLGAVERAAAAMEEIGPATRDELYWLCRVCFVSDRTQLLSFDAAFDAVFHSESQRNEQRSTVRGDAGAARGGDHERRVEIDLAPVEGGAGSGLPWATRPRVVAESDDAGVEEDSPWLPQLLPAADPGLADRPFDELDDDELAIVGALLAEAVPSWPSRRSRRRRLAAGGDRPMLRAALRLAMRTGGEPFRLPRSSPRRRDRPVALLLDVSGSMEPYAKAYLHLARALAADGRAEVFAFATTATRVTPALRLRSPAEAIEHASELVGDRFGGTRLATSIGAILTHRWWRSAVRGAVVVIVSDGWDTDDTALLDRHLARLARTAHRIVWVNPRLAAADYEPLVAGMATALDHCDAFLSGHSLAAMQAVIWGGLVGSETRNPPQIPIGL